jgi:hypothetical protein
MKFRFFICSLSAAKSHALLFFATCLIMLCVTLPARAQESDSTLQTAPPPMKFVSRDERAQLAAAHDAKARTRAGIELAESHLQRAEELSSAHDYINASAELGNYQGLIEEALRFLKDTGRTDGKARDLFKRIELALRAHSPRIETIRRTTPYEYAVNVKAIARFTREARADALNAFYGDTVMREDRSAEERGAEAHAPARDHALDSSTEKKAP